MINPKLACLALFSAFFTAPAVAEDFLTQGDNPTLAIVDGNGNGPGAGDCAFTATWTPVGDFVGVIAVTAQQDTTQPLRACMGTTHNGTSDKGSDDSSNWGQASIINPSISSVNIITVEMVDETSSPSPGSPLHMNDPRDEVALLPEGVTWNDPHDRGRLCTDNGSMTSMITFVDGVSMLVQTDFYPNATSPTHLRFADVPLEEEPSGMFYPLDVYVPINADRTLTVDLSAPASTRIIDIDLDQLAPCSISASPIPTMSHWAIATAVLMIMALGTLALRRLWVFDRS